MEYSDNIESHLKWGVVNIWQKIEGLQSAINTYTLDLMGTELASK